MDEDFACRICGSARDLQPYMLREMLIGLREEFLYYLCRYCGCLQIAKTPEHLERYYPSDYYSLSADMEHHPYWSVRALFSLAHVFSPVVRVILLHRGHVGRLARELFARIDLRLLILEVFSRTGVRRDSSILDVGCGQGLMPYCLRQAGFDRVDGFDPFVRQDLAYRNGLRIFRDDIFSFKAKRGKLYDLIMFNHSLEHMEDQDGVLNAAVSMLRDNGTILIRIPVVDCLAFERYGKDLMSLDPPRHLFIHSSRSMELLAMRANLRVDHVMCDSYEAQFWGSEQYRRDVPLQSPDSLWHNWQSPLFSFAEKREFTRLARLMNREGSGDIKAFFLKKTTTGRGVS